MDRQTAERMFMSVFPDFNPATLQEIPDDALAAITSALNDMGLVDPAAMTGQADAAAAGNAGAASGASTGSRVAMTPSSFAERRAANQEIAKVRRFSESAAMRDALRKAGKTPEQYVKTFSEVVRKNPRYTAKQHGVPASFAA